ncbi:MAG: response regulator, partial [Gemmatimonadetes bacterium]|nr:response regulator [Gemmatimonadota bacterium]
EPDSALGDPRRVSTVVRYLIRSAVAATSEGTVLVEVDEGPEGDFRIAVSDSGVPLGERELRTLVRDPQPDEPSDLPDEALTPSLCRELVALMGGRLTVHNPSGGGLRVVLSLPLPRTPPQEAIPGPRTLNGRPVVLVCTNPLMAGVSAEVITELGGKPMAYGSLEEANSGDHPERSGRERSDELLVVIQSPGRPLPRPDAGIWPGPRIAFTRDDPPTSPSDVASTGFDQAALLPLTHRTLGAACLRLAERSAPPMGDASSDGLSRVLLVEDDPVNQRVAESMLDRLDCSVVRADNGEDALRLVMSEPFDLVLMDCEVPGLDGFQTAQAIRAWEQPQARRVPIVALTARASTEDRDRALRAGMDDFMAKPILIEDLEWMLGRWLPHRDEVGPSPSSPSSHSEQVGSGPERAPGTELPGRDGVKGEDEVVVFDWDAALSRMGGDPDVFTQVFTLFQAGWEEVQRNVPTALAQGDLAAVAAAAHRMKGSAGNLGALRVGHLAGRLEDAARSGQDGDLGHLWLALDEAVERFVRDVHRRTTAGA